MRYEFRSFLPVRLVAVAQSIPEVKPSYAFSYRLLCDKGFLVQECKDQESNPELWASGSTEEKQRRSGQLAKDGFRC